MTGLNFSGISRRVSTHIQTREMAEEISHIVTEAAELADGADAIIELALPILDTPDNILSEYVDNMGEEMKDVLVATMEEVDDDDDDDDDDDIDIDSIDSELDDLEDDLAPEEEDLVESTARFEALVL